MDNIPVFESKEEYTLNNCPVGSENERIENKMRNIKDSYKDCANGNWEINYLSYERNGLDITITVELKKYSLDNGITK